MTVPRQSPSGQALNLQPDEDRYGFVDDFDVGQAISTPISTSGTILQTGAGNWSARSITNSGSFQGFAPTAGPNPAEHPGLMRFFTGNTANDAVVVTKNQNNVNTGQMLSEALDELEFIVLLQNTAVTTCQYKLFAAALDAITYQPTSSIIQLSYDTSDSVSPSSWVARVSGSNPVDTGVQVVPNTTAYFKARFRRRTDSVEIYVNDLLEAEFGNPPSGLISTGFRLQTLAAGNRFITVDRIALQSRRLVR